MPLNNLGTAQGSIKINTSDLKNADLALRSAGRGMIGFGALAIGAFGAIVREAANFEKEMDFVQAVTNATGDQMDALTQKAIELGKKSVYGPVQLSQAFVELAKAGASVEDIIGGVGEASVQLATAADVEIPFAGENLINILNTFQLGAGDAVRVADLLAGAANASSVELSDIVTTMRYAGPVAEALGISIEDVNTALSVLGRVGIKGSTAGTSLRFAMSHLIPDTKKATEAIQGLGLHIDESTGAVVEFTDQDGSLKDLATIFQILQDKTKGLTDQQRVAAVNDIFGVRAMPSVLALMQAGEQGFSDLNDEINRTTAADVAAKRMDNLDGSIKRLKATLSAIMVEAGGPFQQTVKGWVDGLRNLLEAFSNLPGPVQTFLISALLVVGVLSLLAGGFLLTIGNMVRAVRVIGEIANAFTLFTRGAQGASAANATLSAGILASPWFWLVVLIIAVAAAIYLLWTRSEKFRNFVKGFWEDLKNWGKAIGSFFVDAWHSIVDFFSQWDEWWGKIKQGASKAWDAVKGFVSDIGKAIKEFASGVWKDIADAVGVAWDAVAGFFSDIGKWFAGLPAIMGNAVKKAVATVIGWFKKLSWENVGHAIGFAIGRYIRLVFYDMPKKTAEGLIQVFNFFKSIFGQVLSFLGTWAANIASWVATTFVNFIGTIWSFLSQIPGFFINAFTQALNWVIGFAPQMLSWIYNLGLGILTNIVNFIQQIPGKFVEFFTSALNFLINKVPEFAGRAWDIGTGIFNGIINTITGIPQKIWDTLTNGVNMIKNMVTTAYNAAKDFGKGIWDGFKDGIGIHSPSYVEKALMAIDDQADSTMRGLNNTMRSLNRNASGLPVNNSALGLQSPGQLVAASQAYNQNAPLVGTAVIRKDQDITTLARQLDKARAQRARGRGVKLTGDFAAAGV